jgi:heme exporter protein B
MSLQRDWRRARAIAWKDLTAERRSKAGFNAVTSLAITILVLFGFALGPDTRAVRDAAPGVIWLAALFAGVLAFNRSYQSELDSGALEQLVLYPGSRKAIYAGKLLANFVFVALMLTVIIIAGIILFGTIGLVTLGTFYAAMSSRSRAREVLLPLLLFPMLVPVLLAAMEATKALLGGNIMGDAGAWARLLIVFDVVFLAATFLAFESVIEV